MPQIGELFDRLDGAELILAALVPVDEIPIRAEDGEQLVLAIDLFGLDRTVLCHGRTSDRAPAR